jgi:hypothetical protein
MSWSNWTSRGGNLDGHPAVGSNQDGRLEVFGVWRYGQLLHIYQNRPNGDWDTTWYWLGGDLVHLRPTVISNKDGRLEVFAVWKDRTLRHIWQQWSEIISISDVDSNASSSSSCWAAASTSLFSSYTRQSIIIIKYKLPISFVILINLKLSFILLSV